jgi:hypothetical protein
MSDIRGEILLISYWVAAFSMQIFHIPMAKPVITRQRCKMRSLGIHFYSGISQSVSTNFQLLPRMALIFFEQLSFSVSIGLHEPVATFPGSLLQLLY